MLEMNIAYIKEVVSSGSFYGGWAKEVEWISRKIDER
jgi:hypothetical protein